ncbi:MAG: fibronectin type III domain-containing protein, partial [Acidimicrobiia bacterium]
MIGARLRKVALLATLASVLACCLGSSDGFATPVAAPGSKAPQVIPSRPLDLLSVQARQAGAAPLVKPHNLALGSKGAAALALASDATPPTGPSQVTASAQSLVTLNAQWSGAQDPDSGVSYYIFGIGTIPTGSYSTLANVKWWQVTYDTSISINMSLDPTQTYYVSVYAVNGAGISGAIVTSNAVHPAWVTLGQSGNVMQVRFASTGYDASGNSTTGFTADQIATMTSFYNKMYPILVQLYGPPAVSYTVTIVRDLRFQGTNEFFPSTDEIRMSDSFYPQLFTHELVHAFRNDFILASDQNWNYDATLSGFEEGFAQAVSYEAMNVYVQDYPNDSIVAGNTLWGSTYDWDYDFQNVPELRGTDFWSDGGATLLYWTKYEMAAAAIRKINIESPG